MTDFLFAPIIRSVAIHNSAQRFPVSRIFCVGQNYADHAIEMGSDPNRERPFFFSKPASAIVQSGSEIAYPPQTDNLHFEAELVIAIGTGGTDITTDNALSHVFGYAAGNDLTRRDLQAEAKSKGRPWDMAKGFDQSAILGDIHPADAIGHLQSGAITCHVDGALKQSGDLSHMIWKTPEIVSYLSSLVTLQAGDLIMTGTPAGVGALAKGETCHVQIDGLTECRVTLY